MKIGMITDSLSGLSFDEMLAVSAELGLDTLEFGCGNWSSAPHINLDAMLDSQVVRREFVAKIYDYGLTIAALNCSGNPLHPGSQGPEHHRVTEKTIRLAGIMGIERVVMMSGLPGGPGMQIPTGSSRTGHLNAWQSRPINGSGRLFPIGKTLSPLPTIMASAGFVLNCMAIRRSITFIHYCACARPLGKLWAPIMIPVTRSG